MSDWQPIETAPENEVIIVAFLSGSVTTAWLRQGAWWDGSGEFVHDEAPTAWMPLPAHPEEG